MNRSLRVLLAAVMLTLIPAAAFAQSHGSSARDAVFRMRDIDCSGATVTGRGLPAGETMRVRLTNRDNGDVIARREVKVRADGTFSVRLEGPTNMVEKLRAQVADSQGEELGWVDHDMAEHAAMCDLPFTGSSETALAVLATVMLVTGASVLFVTRPRARHAA